MSVRNVEAQIIKLEALQPAPSSPLDGMIGDELTVILLELYADVLALNTLAEEKTEAAKLEARHRYDGEFRVGSKGEAPGFRKLP
ncbi:hypothetical protein [Bradyrhizobium sp. JYMT SZCCT0428]|uniref:hypothetical protein n=1 Tax=Bradyrhizobium sp. JYMT SZCCT0428 TaxID=2807673 RepID=UPI001BABBAFF|nr:hypothetical protein [Bradyrhizobium sp. JYMT SZCCT0428]MBR1153716.1 hypothetical protein [Bradyrhizobium sp. JYMT SZCCT0428]